MDVKAAPNGVATIEDRILRITGYYGYYPGYSSQKSKRLRGCLALGAGEAWDAGGSAVRTPAALRVPPMPASGPWGHPAGSMCAVLGAEPWKGNGAAAVCS